MSVTEAEQLRELRARLLEIDDLNMAAAVLDWDQSTYMPPGGAAARGRQLATLSRLAHERLIDPALGRLLDGLRPYEERLPHDSEEASLIRVARRDFERAVKVPPAFMATLREHQAASYQVWAEARERDDFPAVLPYLERTLDLSRQLADFYPGYEHIADPLIDLADEGITAAGVTALFAELRERLTPIVQAITSQPPADDSCVTQHFPEAWQWAFGLEVVRAIGYDLERGRLDKTPHPFTTKFSIGDVRITTRVNERDLRECLFANLHEAGHGLYEQGVRPSLEGTPLAQGTSSSVHESQSRLWENLVGRSRGFWQHFFPKLQAVFPDQLGPVSLETFYRAINKVQPSLIRVEADEVTYNQHVMLRFDLELALLDGRLAVRDLPDAWRERYRQDLGIMPPTDKDGVMQDVHWYFAHIGGMFQGYTLGNVLAAQFFEAAVRAQPGLLDEPAQGQFDTLRTWLTEQIYQYGRTFTTAELVQRVTGGPIRVEPYIAYLRTKYGELYRL